MSRPSDTLTTHSSTAASVGAAHGSRAHRRSVASAGSLAGDAHRARAAAVRLLGRGGAAAAVRDDRRVRAARASAAAPTRSGSPTTCSSTSRSTAAADAREACFDPIVTLAALARARSARAPRHARAARGAAARPSVLAKALATVDCVSGGRLDVGLGAGWYEPEYEALGMEMPRPGERLDRLVDALEVVKGLLGGGPFTYDGAHHRARDATNRPRRVQTPAAARVRRRQGRPPAAARGASTPTAGTRAGCGRPTPTANGCACSTTRARGSVAIRRRCGARSASTRCAARTSATSSGASSACGELSPPGVLDGVDLATFRDGRLVGTVDEVRAQVRRVGGARRRHAHPRRRRGAVPGVGGRRRRHRVR